MLSDHQRSVIRYWEWRRLFLNLAVLADAWFGWSIANALTTGIDEVPAARLSDPGVIWQFVLMFVVANAVFCVGYAVDLVIQRPKKFWPKPFRSILFVVICMAAICLLGNRAGKIAKEAAYTKAGVFGYGASAQK